TCFLFYVTGNAEDNILLPAYSYQFSSVAQLFPVLCDPMDCSPPDSPVHGISQARILDWVAISFSIKTS
ncbi:hypothetical protein ACQUGX_13365, partial [Enterococcus faecium]|uniref:hypothetical protein n=1 Tax=Enterococcus faecium TaxID=1352 RepID=UPI003D1B440E